MIVAVPTGLLGRGPTGRPARDSPPFSRDRQKTKSIGAAPVSNDTAGTLRTMQPRYQRYRGGLLGCASNAAVASAKTSAVDRK